MSVFRTMLLTTVLLASMASPARADGFISPFVGFNFGGDSSNCASLSSCEEKRLNWGASLGTVRGVFTAFNPQGCVVTSFKAPSSEELKHDYLWRIHKHVPPRGEVGVFNRSHYEDVLVVRVDNLVPRDTWSNPLTTMN